MLVVLGSMSVTLTKHCIFFPVQSSDGDCVAVMASNVDDLLYSYLPEGEDTEEISLEIRSWIN